MKTAVIHVSIPDAEAEILRQFMQYTLGSGSTLRDFFDTQVAAFEAMFGPACVASVIEVISS